MNNPSTVQFEGRETDATVVRHFHELMAAALAGAILKREIGEVNTWTYYNVLCWEMGEPSISDENVYSWCGVFSDMYNDVQRRTGHNYDMIPAKVCGGRIDRLKIIM